MSLGTLHQALSRPPFLVPLFTRSLSPIRPLQQEQKISYDLPDIICTTLMHRLAWPPWKLAPLVELK